MGARCVRYLSVRPLLSFVVVSFTRISIRRATNRLRSHHPRTCNWLVIAGLSSLVQKNKLSETEAETEVCAVMLFFFGDNALFFCDKVRSHRNDRLLSVGSVQVLSLSKAMSPRYLASLIYYSKDLFYLVDPFVRKPLVTAQDGQIVDVIRFVSASKH